MYERVPLNGAIGNSVKFPIGTELLAKFSFAGNAPEDLPFERNDILVITSLTKDPNWYKCRRRKDEKEGMVPANYVKKVPTVLPKGMDWFHGGMSREEAEAGLNGQQDGTYLIRESTNFPGDYTLCVAYQGKTEHYRIQYRNFLLTCDDEEFFETLPDLVRHYERDADGLCHRLVRALRKARRPSPSEDVGLATRQLRDSGWTIPRADLQIGDPIGRGEFGDVLIGFLRGEKVAVKAMKSGSRMAESFLAEASLMTSLRHRNLVRMLGMVIDDVSQLYLVTEFMPNGSLLEFLRSRGRLQVTPSQQISFAIDVCRGMGYLEANDLVHRDLAARNVLLAVDMSAKVSDFGLARHLDKSRSLEDDAESSVFPIKWTAPEALRHSVFTSKSDIWSFGVLLWEIYSFGRVPYPRIPVEDVIRHIEGGYRMDPPEACPQLISRLMKEAWCLEPTNRPTFDEALHRLEAVQGGGPGR